MIFTNSANSRFIWANYSSRFTHYSHGSFKEPSQLFLKSKPIILNNNFTIILSKYLLLGSMHNEQMNTMSKWLSCQNEIRSNYRRPVVVLRASWFCDVSFSSGFSTDSDHIYHYKCSDSMSTLQMSSSIAFNLNYEFFVYLSEEVHW